MYLPQGDRLSLKLPFMDLSCSSRAARGVSIVEGQKVCVRGDWSK